MSGEPVQLPRRKMGARSDSSESDPQAKQSSHGKANVFGMLLEAVPATLISVATIIVVIIRLMAGCVRGAEKRKAAVRDAKKSLLGLLGTGSLVRKALRVLWFCIFIILVSSMLGFRFPSSTGARMLKGYRGPDLMHPFGSDGLFSRLQTDGNVKLDTEEKDAGKEEDEVPDPVAVPPVEKKKWKRKDEVRLACEEVDCQTSCQKKVTKKCLKSENCMKERARTCKKKCRKTRCETRCVDEPTLGYVEKEMKLESCKDACQNDKCKTKCDHEFEGCKVKCKASAHRYSCDRPVESEAAPPIKVSENSNEDETEEEFSLKAEVEEDDPPI